MSRANELTTTTTTTRAIMRSQAFRRGFADQRAGRPPAFDEEDDWDYERGRQFAIIAPRSVRAGIIDAATIRLFDEAYDRCEIR